MSVRSGQFKSQLIRSISLAGVSVFALAIYPSVCAFAQSNTTVESVTVTGRVSSSDEPGGGLLGVETDPRAIQTISDDFISKQSPTANVEQLMAMLPSANVSDVDSYGLASGQVYIRGLGSTEIGFVLEGTPLNDVGTSAFFANEQVEAEDLEMVSVQPGSVNISTPTLNGTAGQVLMKMRDPQEEFGGLIDASMGSYNMDRQYLRLDTGNILGTGILGMVSASHTFADNWVGPGGALKYHIDSKLRKDFGGGSYISVVTSWNWEVANSYRYPTLAQFASSGKTFSYDATFTPGDTAYYKLNVSPYKNLTTSIPMHFVINDRLTLDNTPYIWYGQGTGASGSTLTVGSNYVGNQKVTLDPIAGQPTTPGATQVVQQFSDDYQLRPGNVLKATYQLDDHNSFTAGWWLQASDQHQYTRLGLVNQTTGQPLDYWGQKNYVTYNGGIPYDSPSYTNKVTVNVLFVGDDASYFGDRLKVQAGFKYAWVGETVDSLDAGASPHQNLLVQKALPQFGASWQLDGQNQLYTTVSTNFHTALSASLVNQYNRSTGVQSSGSGQTKPEFSVAEEIGYRYTGDFLVASVSGFHYYFTNRQLTLNQQFGSQALSQSINAGSQETFGVDAQVGTHPIFFNLRPYVTFEYLDAKIIGNLPVTSTLNGATIADFLPTNGKTQVGSPTYQTGVGLDYDDGNFFAAGQFKYVDSQYMTFVNDAKIPGYTTSRLSLGYRLPEMGFAKAPQIQLNITNVGNTSALSGVEFYQPNAAATTGLRGGTIAAGSPAAYRLPPFNAMVTLSTAF